ncbi:MAG: hypothetical protein DMD92_19995 [Candidatus Rokuibacteriota bacterium]|nr:MAG: hypothetical protein DMD92_19995 [Candidatus Rokubacteria bacterium]
MVSVSAQTPLSAVLDDARTALARRVSYLCFPGLSRGADANGSANRRALCHDLDLPIVGHRRQSVTLSVGREGRDGRRFTVRGDLVSIAGRWRLEPFRAGVLAHLTLDYDVSATLKGEAVNELRSRSPLPIRTDADAILGRAVDDYFETRFAEDAAAYCDRLRARLEGPAS